MSLQKPSYTVIIPSAGSGSRMGQDIPKQYLLVNGKSILEHTVMVFASMPQISQIIIVTQNDDQFIDSYLNWSAKVQILKCGGKYRAQTVLNALQQLACEANDWVLIHDAARCCITAGLVEKLILSLAEDQVGGILALKAPDTLKQVKDGVICSTLDRSQVYYAQTPQMFRYQILLNALLQAKLDEITDDASAVEALGLPVKIVDGSSTNIKVTYITDLLLVESIIK
jgi:2-C-methyl-D-erythritol 4-phosphate cytidylyltransferase